MAGGAPLAAGLEVRERARCLDLIAQLDALPAGDSRMLTDLEGRRYRAQRGQVLTRHGFAYSLASTGQGETRFEIRFTPMTDA